MLFPFLIQFFVSLIVSLLVTPKVRAFAISHQIGDLPGARKIHLGFIPRMGGIGVIAGWFSGIVVAIVLMREAFSIESFNPVLVLISLSLIAAVGIYDDVKGIGSTGKLTVQALAASIVIFAGLKIEMLALPFLTPVSLGIFSIPLTMLWLVGVTNAFNLLDGLDGLASGVAAIAALTFFIVGVYFNDVFLMVTMLPLIFGCIGFLRYNFHPASIFMGDTGSLFLGFLLGTVSLRVLNHTALAAQPVSLLVVIIALAVPIVDTSVAFFRRIKKGMHPLKADKEHIHHRLMDLGLSHRQTVVIHYAIALSLGVLAFTLLRVDAVYASLIFVVVVASVYFSIHRLGYIEEMSAKQKNEKPPIQPLSIARIIEKTMLVGSDFAAVFIAFIISYWFRFHSGVFQVESYAPLELYFTSPTVLLSIVLWLFIFALAGLYDIPWDYSRVDYVFLICKTVGWGTLFIFLVTFDFSTLSLQGRLTTLVYGVAISFCVVVLRMLITNFERKHEILGFRRRNTLIIGANNLAGELLDEFSERSGLKYKIIGLVDQISKEPSFHNIPVLGTYDVIPELVKKNNIEEVIIAATIDSREEILSILARCNGMLPTVKVMAQNIDILSGFKTEEIAGHPLIRLYMTNMKRWQWFAKRMIDVGVSLIILFPLLPLWFIVAIFIKLDSAGSVLFTQERVGKKGQIFKLYKFRSMIPDAEKETGPVWASPDDVRVTKIGRILRKLRLDELPQFINVLKGEMSLVGPRPERPFFVDVLKKEVRFYGRRLLVRPGITGWAQVNHRYDITLDDVKEKIKYDLYYLENMSLTLDLKILLRTIIVALSGKGTH